MKRERYIKKPMSLKKSVPFEHVEEAWFWYINSERARRDGATPSQDYKPETRPCDPDDMYRFVMALRKRNKIRDEHLRVLAHYGWRDCPPDPRVPKEARPFALWGEALDRLSTILKAKGILRVDEYHYSLQA